MSGLPIKYRVRLAFGFYPVGYTFISPPMSRGYAEQLRGRGYLEVIDETHETHIAAPEPKRRGRPKTR